MLLQCLSLFSHHFLSVRLFSPSVSQISFYLSLIRTHVIGFSAHLDNPGLDPHLKILTASAKILFANKISHRFMGFSVDIFLWAFFQLTTSLLFHLVTRVIF